MSGVSISPSRTKLWKSCDIWHKTDHAARVQWVCSILSECIFGKENFSLANLKNVPIKKKLDKLKFPYRQNAPLQFLPVCNVNLWPLNELQRNYHSKKFPSFSCSTFQEWFVTICSSEAQLSFVTWHMTSFRSEKAPLTLCFCPPTWGTSKRQYCWEFFIGKAIVLHGVKTYLFGGDSVLWVRPPHGFLVLVSSYVEGPEKQILAGR